MREGQSTGAIAPRGEEKNKNNKYAALTELNIFRYVKSDP
jgi:hypothetical protein